MEPIINFIKSFAEELNSRAKSRWLTCLIMSWLIYNWKRFVTLIFTDNRTPDLVQSTISDMIRMGSTNPCCVWVGYGIIIAISAFWIYGRPIVDTYIDSAQHWIKKRFKVEEKATIMKRENMNTHEYYMSQQQYDSHYKREADRLKIKLDECRARNALLESTHPNHAGKEFPLANIIDMIRGTFNFRVTNLSLFDESMDAKKRANEAEIMYEKALASLLEVASMLDINNIPNRQDTVSEGKREESPA